MRFSDEKELKWSVHPLDVVHCLSRDEKWAVRYVLDPSPHREDKIHGYPRAHSSTAETAEIKFTFSPSPGRLYVLMLCAKLYEICCEAVKFDRQRNRTTALYWTVMRMTE